MGELVVLGELVDPFDEFWSAYPRKIDKKRARRSYEAALKDADHAVIMEGLHAWCAHWRTIHPKFVPHPTTWLNNERWESMPPASTTTPKGFASIAEALGRA